MLLLLSIILLFFNSSSWQYDGFVSVVMFITFAEVFIFILSLIACIKPKQEKRKTESNGDRDMERVGALIAFILLSLLSLIFLGLDIPYPSTLILCIIFTNFMVALYSILFHPIALGIYEANVYQEKTTMLDYIFKYIAIYFSGINYYVQMTLLLRIPVLLNKLIAIIFVLFLLWQAVILIGIFGF